MRRFTIAVLSYVVLCLAALTAIVLHGDGPHPRIVAIYPANGDRYWPGGGAEIAFSQPMNQTSVESALQVSPGAQGEGAWYGNTLNIQPNGDWRPNVTYHVQLTGKVTDTLGRPLHTPFSFWFRVHHVQQLTFCTVRGVRNVCERQGERPLTHSSTPVGSYALSSDGSMLAYTRPDRSGLPHLFVVSVDGTGARQLTFGTRYADSAPFWAIDDTNDVSYYRRPVLSRGAHPRLGTRQLWNIQTDGSQNARL